ncbi:MAG: ABC transporter ATP-binding protein, partial [Gordonibacter sp.]
MFAVEDIRFSYHARREVLKGVTFCLEKGEILCLLGSNGTGKTTLLRCLLGFSKPQHGSVSIDGRDVSAMRVGKRARYLAYVPQSSELAFPYQAKEVVLMGRVSHLAVGAAHAAADKQAALDAMERLQIAHLASRRYQELSGGEKQMVLVARALAQEAQLLVMDEPTANLDYHNQVKILV